MPAERYARTTSPQGPPDVCCGERTRPCVPSQGSQGSSNASLDPGHQQPPHLRQASAGPSAAPGLLAVTLLNRAKQRSSSPQLGGVSAAGSAAVGGDGAAAFSPPPPSTHALNAMAAAAVAAQAAAAAAGRSMATPDLGFGLGFDGQHHGGASGSATPSATRAREGQVVISRPAAVTLLAAVPHGPDPNASPSAAPARGLRALELPEGPPRPQQPEQDLLMAVRAWLALSCRT